MTALDFLKFEDRLAAQEDTDHVISINRWNTRKFKEHQLEHIFSTFGLDRSEIKILPHYEDLVHYGTIAA